MEYAHLAKEEIGTYSEEGKSYMDRFKELRAQLKSTDELTRRENQLKLLGAYLAFHERQSENGYVEDKETGEIVEDPVFNPENDEKLYKNVMNDLETDSLSMDMAVLAPIDNDVVNCLPGNEYEPVDEVKIYQTLGIRKDREGEERTFADKLTEQLLIKGRMQNLDKDIYLEQRQCDINELMTTSLVIDKNVFKAIYDEQVKDNTYLNSALPREQGGQHTVDDMNRRFRESKAKLNGMINEESGEWIYDNLHSDEYEEFDDKIKDARSLAGERIGMYLSMKKVKDGRSFLDKLSHPFRSIKEHFAVRGMKNDLKKDYNLTDENLKNIGKIVESSHNVQDMGIFKRDNSTKYMRVSQAEVEKEQIKEMNDLVDDMDLSERLDRDFQLDANVSSLGQSKDSMDAPQKNNDSLYR